MKSLNYGTIWYELVDSKSSLPCAICSALYVIYKCKKGVTHSTSYRNKISICRVLTTQVYYCQLVHYHKFIANWIYENWLLIIILKINTMFETDSMILNSDIVIFISARIIWGIWNPFDKMYSGRVFLGRISWKRKNTRMIRIDCKTADSPCWKVFHI